jgi:hypothetical protein
MTTCRRAGNVPIGTGAISRDRSNFNPIPVNKHVARGLPLLPNSILTLVIEPVSYTHFYCCCYVYTVVLYTFICPQLGSSFQ